MIEKILEFSMRQRGMVLAFAALLLAGGVFAVLRLPVDAVPDLTGIQVQINTEVPALAPEETERSVTRVIELEMQGLPGLEEVRSLTKFGLSQVTMAFEDGTNILQARQLVGERLAAVLDELPKGCTPKLAPISTGLGEIFYYALSWKDGALERPRDQSEALMMLTDTQEYVVKPMMRSVRGVAEINSIGGQLRQVMVEPDLEALVAAGLTVADLADVVRANVENAGGGIVARDGRQVTIRSVGRVTSADEIRALPVKFGAGVEPIRVRDVAKVAVGAKFRTGGATLNGEEAVIGTVMMLAGENARVVCQRVIPKLDEVRAKLSAGMELKVVYDRRDLVERTIGTVKHNLFEGAVLVVVVLIALLGNWRAALIVAAAIPLSFLFAISGMVKFGISGNLMSLGAVDFGLIIDGAVVMVENIVCQIAHRQHGLGRVLTREERMDAVLTASRQVGNPMFFGVLIITLVYVPILALTGIEGKMFRPMALTVMLALFGALLLALTLMPVACSFFLSGRVEEKDNLFIRVSKWFYVRVLKVSLRMRWLTVLGAVGLFAFSVRVFFGLGAEFVPKLDEGAINALTYREVGMSLEESLKQQVRVEQMIRERFPQVTLVFSRFGTSEVATDPMPASEGDMYVFYRPFAEWPKGPGMPTDKAGLADAIEKLVKGSYPNTNIEFSQPIEARFNEMLEGSKSELSVKVFGQDFDVMERLAASVRDVIKEVPGGDSELEVDGRTSTLVLQVRRDELIRRNIPSAEVNRAVAAALAGDGVGYLFEGVRRREIVVRLRDGQRADVETIKGLPVRVGDAGIMRLGQLVDVSTVETVEPIRHEAGRRKMGLIVNVEGRDMEGFVHEAMARIREKVEFPDGYEFEFGGTFKNLEEARERLAIVVPAALILILVLIFMAFRSLRQTLMIATGIPLALSGGILGLALRGQPFSISAAVGFIALSGVAVLNGLVMITYFNQIRAAGVTVAEAVVSGALSRLRPVLMTALVAALGFIPMAIATGAGSEVQRPLATVVIGGILSSTFLTLVLLPVLYAWLERDGGDNNSSLSAS